MLEDLALQLAADNIHGKVKLIYDQYIEYICLEKNLFSLNMTGSFSSIFGARSSVENIESICDKISSNLFSVFVTLGKIPYITFPKDGPSEMISTKLDSKIRSHLMNSKSQLFATDGSLSKRVLTILVDRSQDLATPLMHGWSYDSLINDVIGISLNKIVFAVDGKRKVLDIDEKDTFWQQNASHYFPIVAENIDKELVKYKQEMANISILKESESSFQAHDIKSALNAVPELTERKRLIDTHMNMAMYLLNEIKSRGLDSFFEVESSALKPGKLDSFFRDDSKGDVSDKMRLLLFYFMSCNVENDPNFSSFENYLRSKGCNMAALEYLKTQKSLLKLTDSDRFSNNIFTKFNKVRIYLI